MQGLVIVKHWFSVFKLVEDWTFDKLSMLLIVNKSESGPSAVDAGIVLSFGCFRLKCSSKKIKNKHYFLFG